MDGCRADCEDCQFSSLCEKFVEFEELVDYLLSDVPENLLSDDEYIILKNLDKQWKWIARDDGYSCILHVYNMKPTKDNYSWKCIGCLSEKMKLFNHLFQFVKWEDDEPYKIEKLLAAYEENEYGK